eukprot:8444910-Pyramimonas_sp.AAC.1
MGAAMSKPLAIRKPGAPPRGPPFQECSAGPDRAGRVQGRGGGAVGISSSSSHQRVTEVVANSRVPRGL